MTDEPQPPDSGAGRRRLPVVLVLLALCALLAAQRWQTHLEPLDRDVATYVVIGQEMLHGRPLYSDLWEHKPPGLFVPYAAALALAGSGPLGLYLLGVACGISTLLAVFTAARRAGGGAGVGLIAAALWVVVGGDLALQANLPSGEVLLNALLPWSLALLVGGVSRRSLVAAGLCLALAGLVKPFVALHAGTLVAALVVLPPAGTSRLRALREGLLMPGLVVAAWLAALAYFSATGRFGDFWDAVIVYNQSYAGGMLGNLREGLAPQRLLPAFLMPQLPLVTLAAIGVVALVSRARTPALLILAFLGTTWVTVVAPGQFFPHYYQLWLPPLCIAAALGLGALAGREQGQATRILIGSSVAVLALLGLIQAPSYSLAPEDWSRKKYGEVFVRAAQTGGLIDRLLEPGETFYQWGIEPSFYYYSGRRPPAGVLWSEVQTSGPLRVVLRTRTLEQLSANPPELWVVWREIGPPSGALGDWFRESYASFPPPYKGTGFSFWYRKGGRLEQRLRRDGLIADAPAG